MKKRIAILGSTGSIGTQALDVIAQHPQEFEVEVLTAHHNLDLLVAQAKQFEPNAVVIACEELYLPLKEALLGLPIKVFAGSKALSEIVMLPGIDVVINALVGIAGLLPTLAAIDAKKTIALANKETLVVAGDLIRQLAINKGISIIPVDSEHSAIFQCLVGESAPVEKIILTASGGPFLHTPAAQLANVSKREALQHPQWNMGAKVSIDSATMMNKGFEVIEARWLFDVRPAQIEVAVHPQSVVHSLVQFADGSLKAQLGTPDMRIPISYALSFPKRLKLNTLRYNFTQNNTLTFLPPDVQKFPCLQLAYDALTAGGVACCALNAANEIAVQAFLDEKITFTQIFSIAEQCLLHCPSIAHPTLDDYLATDAAVRIQARQLCNL
ncbi:1-deoxy-D-xylulose 5-phosphate reductoisomerase [Bacteroidia bacterium]|nr:1-deoxy-D-xylulose 5-phosphate reductoisomerase [Bacteroidia bacterium]GHT83100.1 1-deoxy-D-xylulose 5-phosphate reductoisomerase [Bacteroidia bacterium]